jgi:(p)ppGpp synthase/HD superfamily hydrolase
VIPQTKTAQAFALAEWLHGDQYRKNSDEEALRIPYLTHLIDVMSLLIQVGANDDQLIAGLLHDALEDQPETPDGEDTHTVISQIFGARVLELVEAATDGNSGEDRGPSNWHPRKQAHLDEMASHVTTDPEALLVPLADKLANGQAIVNDLHLVGPVVWDRFNAGRDEVLWYYTSALAVFESAFGADHVLVSRLRRVVAEMSNENVGK